MRTWALGLLAGVASGADLHVMDLRTLGGVELASVAAASQTSVTPAGGGSSTSSTDARTDHMIAIREGIQGIRGRLGQYGGLIWGAGFSVSHYYFNSTLGHTRIVNPAVDGYVGYGYAFTNWLHAELGPVLGGGFSLFSEQPSTGPIDNRSRFFEYGFRVGFYATVADSWQAGLEFPTMVGHSRPKIAMKDASGAVTVITQDNTFRSSGVLVSLGIHF